MKGFLRRILLGMMAVTALVGLSTAAPAALVEWDGTLSIEFDRLLPSMVSSATGIATVNNSSGLGHLHVIRLDEGLTATGFASVSTSVPPEIASITGTAALGGGTISEFNNTLPVPGRLRWCFLLVGCQTYADVPLTTNETRGVGIGGLITVNGFGSGYRFSLQGAPWVVGPATITGAYTDNATAPWHTTTLVASGWVHAPASLTSSTADTGGVAQAVTPVVVMSSPRLSIPFNRVSGFATLRIHVPEPGRLLLLCSGIGGLALLSRCRLRR